MAGVEVGKRANRGKRISQLLEDEQEADDEFWQQDFFAEVRALPARACGAGRPLSASDAPGCPAGGGGRRVQEREGGGGRDRLRLLRLGGDRPRPALPHVSVAPRG
eukprot:scaffold4011_cov237-Prasinococcus_capsulatus_cf.AAC.1